MSRRPRRYHTREPRMKIILSALAAAILAFGAAQASAQSPDNNKDLAAALRRGGYVILMRHGATFSDQADTDPFNLADVTKQRNLNDKGKELARAFGQAIRSVGLPIGEVYTSKFNRAYEPAVLAGFKDI